MGSLCISCFWLIVTLSCVVLLLFSMLSPVWFENQSFELTDFNQTRHYYGQIVTIGLLRYCRQKDMSHVLAKCNFFQTLSSVPNSIWIIALLSYCIGIILLITSVLFSVLLFCIGRKKGNSLRIVLVYIQSISVIFLGASIFMFPFVLDAKFSQHACGKDASMFSSGDCTVGWGYALAIVSILLTIFSPILIRYSTEKYEDDDEYEYNFVKYDTQVSTAPLVEPKQNVMTTV